MNYDRVCLMMKAYFEEKDEYANTLLYFDETSISQAFCHIRDIGREEFYLGKNNRYRPSKVITMRKNQYIDCEYIIFGNSLDVVENVIDFVDGKTQLYKVIRTYAPSSNILPRDRKSYKGSYAPTTDDIEIVVEVLKGTPAREVRRELIKVFQDEIRISHGERIEGKTYE
ncbi:hypothetical protein K8P03_05135 [Anaerococcus murdochii]|uniref:Uncharacterized protein n=1 Tax=Anaerococcus murdochii TaxID=411577 RepID=A0ABS7SYR7_9FIRM|nr:hypothetical protein [Anaerococcus murdochii]MBZ2386682.1 hypothetical protein [Anaerococcus murdochii]